MSKVETVNPVKTLLRVHVNESTLQVLEAEAKEKNRSVEEVATQRLFRFGHVDSTKPIVLEDPARQHLEKLLGRNLTTQDELVSAVQRALSIQAGGVEIPITPHLLERLYSRCIGMEFPKFMQQTVKRLLEEFAGLR